MNIKCINCRKLISINIRGYIDCKEFSETTLKLFCRYYEPEGEGAEE